MFNSMASHKILLYVLLAVLVSHPIAYAHAFKVDSDRRRPIGIGHKLWNDLVTYTDYAFSAYYANCSSPPFGSIVFDHINIENTSTQAYVFQHDASMEYILAFPGTQDPYDRKLDRRTLLRPLKIRGVKRHECRGCLAHRGFMEAWNSIADSAANSLSTALLKNPGYKVIIVGHSLGGAIASLATASFKTNGFSVSATYTFGQPRTGNKAYADFIDRINHVKKGSAGDFHRVTHANDGVPQWPVRSKGYHHHSTEYWEKNNRKLKTQTRGKTFRCFGQESPYCSASTDPNGIVDHAHNIYSGLTREENFCGY